MAKLSLYEIIPYRFCAAFSVLPYDTNSTRLNAVYETSVCKTATRYFMLALLLTSGVYCVYADMSHYSHEHTFLRLTMLIAATVETAGCDAFALVSTVGSTGRFRAYKCRLVKMLNRVDTLLSMIDSTSPKFKLQRRRSCTSKRTGNDFAFAFLVYLYLCVFVSDFVVWYRMVGLDVVCYLPVYSFKYSILLFTVQFAKIVLHFSRSYVAFNNALRNCIGLQSDLFNHHIYITGSGASIRLRKLREIQLTLYCGVQATAAVFGNQVSAAMLCIFVHLIVSPYFMFLDIIYPPSEGYFYACYMLVQSLWVFLHAIQLNLLLVPCAITTKQANRTSTIVCKFLSNAMASETRKQLETFTMQLVQLKIEFSAGGLFRMDLPVIAAVAGAVTAYLLILIQFQNLDSVHSA